MFDRTTLRIMSRIGFASFKSGVPGFSREEVRVKLLKHAGPKEVDEALKEYDSAETPEDVAKSLYTIGATLTDLEPLMAVMKGGVRDARGLDESDRLALAVVAVGLGVDIKDSKL